MTIPDGWINLAFTDTDNDESYFRCRTVVRAYTSNVTVLRGGGRSCVAVVPVGALAAQRSNV